MKLSSVMGSFELPDLFKAMIDLNLKHHLVSSLLDKGVANAVKNFEKRKNHEQQLRTIRVDFMLRLGEKFENRLELKNIQTLKDLRNLIIKQMGSVGLEGSPTAKNLKESSRVTLSCELLQGSLSGFVRVLLDDPAMPQFKERWLYGLYNHLETTPK